MSEVEYAFRLVTGSDIPDAGLRIVRSGGLEQERRNRDEITETYLAGADRIGDGILGSQSTGGEAVNHRSIGVVANLDPGIRRRVTQMAVRLIGDCVEGLRHRAMGVSFHFPGMASSTWMVSR